MREADFFEKIIHDCDTNEEAVLKILEARGFLFDTKDGKTFVSDNATPDDLEYLSEGLEKYRLGKVSVGEIDARGNIVPFTAQVKIDKNAVISDAIYFYEETGRACHEAQWGDMGWRKFVKYYHGVKCDLRILEPYVGYYVKAVSACGVWTNYSCDGNHSEGGKVIVGSYYPFNLWHEYLLKHFLTQFDLDIIKLEEGLDFTKDNQYDTYYKLYQAADYLYKNRIMFRSLKSEIMKDFTNKMIKDNCEKDLEDLFDKRSSEIIEYWGDFMFNKDYERIKNLFDEKIEECKENDDMFNGYRLLCLRNKVIVRVFGAENAFDEMVALFNGVEDGEEEKQGHYGECLDILTKNLGIEVKKIKNGALES